MFETTTDRHRIGLDVAQRRLVVTVRVGSEEIVQIDDRFATLAILSETMRDAIGYAPARAVVEAADPEGRHPDLRRLGAKG